MFVSVGTATIAAANAGILTNLMTINAASNMMATSTTRTYRSGSTKSCANCKNSFVNSNNAFRYCRRSGIVCGAESKNSCLCCFDALTCQ